MKPIKPEHSNMVLGEPKGWDEATQGPCKSLHVIRVGDVFHSYWKISLRDRIKVLFGKPIRLSLTAAGHPPVCLQVDPDRTKEVA